MSQLRSISRLTSLNIGNAFIGMANSVAMAWLFGTSDRMQSYFAAATLLTIVQRVFFVGQFSEMFLPEYVQRREVDGQLKADRCFSALYNHLILMLILTMAAAFVVMPWVGGIIAPGFTRDEQHQVVRLAQALMVVMLLVVANGHLQIIGNARGWYGRFEFYGLVGSAVGFGLLLITGRTLGIWALVVSQGVTQVVLLWGSWRYLYRQGYRHAWIWNEPGFSVWRVVGRVGLTAIYVLATQFYVVAFNASLTFLPPGTLAVYKYAENLYSRVGTLFMRPVGVVFFTDAALLAHRNPSQLRERMSNALYHYALMYLGVLVVLFPALPNVLGVLWGSPRYHLAEIQLTTVFAWFFFGMLIVEGGGLLYRRLNVIMGDMRLHYALMTVVQAAMAVVAPMMVRHWGVLGAALVLIVNITCLALAGFLIILWRRPQYLAFFPAATWKLAATALPALGVAWLMRHAWPILNYQGDYSLMGKFGELACAALFAGTGLITAAAVAWILGVEEARVAWHKMRGWRITLRVSHPV